MSHTIWNKWDADAKEDRWWCSECKRYLRGEEEIALGCEDKLNEAIDSATGAFEDMGYKVEKL